MKKGSRIGKVLGGLLRYVLATVSLSIIFYIVFALFFSTEEERRLERENRLYRQLYGSLTEREQLISDVVDGLLEKDDAIYEELFETEAPTLNAVTAADLIPASDSLSENFLLSSAASKSESLMMMARNVDDNFREVFRLLAEHRDSIPPLSMPLQNVSYVQTGASVGLKHNPIYKLEMQHEGIDLIAPQGAPVFAAADGVVSQEIHSRKGLGNIVEIDHKNGYCSRYCLLGDITVHKGKTVKKGQQVGTVGISTSAPAAHLHYEVLYRGAVLDPVNYLFASVTPDDYAKMLYMAVRTSQSMD